MELAVGNDTLVCFRPKATDAFSPQNFNMLCINIATTESVRGELHTNGFVILVPIREGERGSNTYRTVTRAFSYWGTNRDVFTSRKNRR